MSYQVVIVGAREPKRIIAPCRFSTRAEANEFGEASARVFRHYIFLEDWSVEEVMEPANCVFAQGGVVWMGQLVN